MAKNDAPALGGERRRRDPRLWGALLGNSDRQRANAARVLRATEQERWYAHQLLRALPELQPWSRARAGDALALLGDPRFSPPYFLPEMIRVPGGELMMGSEEFADEYPVHHVKTKPFALAQYPVIQAAYAAFIQATGYRKPSSWAWGRMAPVQANQPVTFVSARDADAYCAWLSTETGYHYRLPTEAEWELAAKGPESHRRYPWGNEYQEGCANVWGENPLRRVCAVGLFPEGRGPFNHDDLAGNVWEWCSSLYWPYPYRADDGREAPGPSDEKRVMRGGCWRGRPVSARCAARRGEPPSDSFITTGFRLARDE